MYCDLFVFMFSGMLFILVIILVFLQQIEIWKESENGVLDISIKLYVKKDTHMVSFFLPHCFREISLLCCCFNNQANLILWWTFCGIVFITNECFLTT